MGILEISGDESESIRHFHAIQILSKELKVPVEILTESYENKLKEILKTAKVRDYIVLVVMHEVRESLRGAVSV